MTPPPPSRLQLSWLLEREVSELESLVALLREESQVLLARQPEPLERLLEAKSHHLSEITSLEKRREELFEQLGLGGTSEQVAASLDTLFPSRESGKLWQRLLRLARECRELNRINGATVEIGQRHLSQALNILHGHTHDQALYAQDGTRRRENTSRLLGQA